MPLVTRGGACPSPPLGDRPDEYSEEFKQDFEVVWQDHFGGMQGTLDRFGYKRGVPAGELELRDLQDAMRLRRSQEEAADVARRKEVLREELEKEEAPLSNSPPPAPVPAPVPQKHRKEEPGNGKKKKGSKPAWQDVWAGDSSIPEDPPKIQPSRHKDLSPSREDFLKGLYTRGQEFQEKRDKKLRRKAAADLKETVRDNPEITEFARGYREDVPRDDAAMGKFYYNRGAEFEKKRRMGVERQRKMLQADEGLRERPEITEMAQGIRDANPPKEVGKYMFARGEEFKKNREMRLRRATKQVRADEGFTFSPAISERTRNLALAAEAREQGMAGAAARQGITRSAPEARLYDKGKLFERARMQKREKWAADQRKQEMSEQTGKPVISERSRKLAERGRSLPAKRFVRVLRGEGEEDEEQEEEEEMVESNFASILGSRHAAFLFSPPHSGRRRGPSPSPPPRAQQPHDSSDPFSPPDFEQMLAGMRIRQELRAVAGGY